MAKTTKVTITFNRFNEIAAQLPDEAMEIVADTIAEIDADVQTGMAAGGTGRIYGNHQASAPGEMPARDMGFLAASLQTEFDEKKSTGYYYSSEETAPHLEYGTVHMAARPFMTPAAERARPGFIREMKDLESRLR